MNWNYEEIAEREEMAELNAEIDRILAGVACDDALIAAEVAERDDIVELAELAEESAMSELAAFGNCHGWFFGSADASIVWETGFELWQDERVECFNEDWSLSEEWLAWDAASEDIPDFFELSLSV